METNIHKRCNASKDADLCLMKIYIYKIGNIA